MKNRKGVLLTLGFVMLASLLFSAGFLIAHYENEAEQGTLQNIIMDSMYSKHVFLSSNIRRIFEISQATSIDYGSDYIGISADIGKLSSLRDKISAFGNFAEVMDDSIEFSADSGSYLILSIEPYGMVYNQSYSENKITITLNSNSDGLEILITLEINITGIWQWSEETSGDYNAGFRVIGSNGDEITQKNINLQGQNRVSIPVEGGIVAVEIRDGVVTINTAGGSASSKIFLKNAKGLSIKLTSPYKISSDTDSAEFTGSPQISENYS